MLSFAGKITWRYARTQRVMRDKMAADSSSSGHSAGASASTVQHNQPSSKEDLDKLPVSRNLARLLDLTFATEQSMYGKIGKLEKNVSELEKTIAMRDETISDLRDQLHKADANAVARGTSMRKKSRACVTILPRRRATTLAGLRRVQSWQP